MNIMMFVSFTQNICSNQKHFFYVAHLDVRDYNNYNSVH